MIGFCPFISPCTLYLRLILISNSQRHPMKFSVEISHSIKGKYWKRPAIFCCRCPYLISCSSNAPPPLSWAFYSLYSGCFIVRCPTWEDHSEPLYVVVALAIYIIFNKLVNSCTQRESMSVLEYQAMPSLREVAQGGVLCTDQPQTIGQAVWSTEWQRPHSGVYSIMMEKSAQTGEGGECTAHPPPFTISTSTYKVVANAPAERAAYFSSTPVCTLWS